MDDAVRPSKERFSQVLDDSYSQWLSYLKNANTTPQLPSYCADLKCTLRRTPSFLGYDLLSGDVKLPFTCVEKDSGDGQFGLLASGSSVWAVSRGDCRLEPHAIPLDILLAVPHPLTIHISDSAPLAKWPGLDGFLEHDGGNHLTVLFLAWAYVFSARWVEALQHSSGHRCTRKFKERILQPAISPEKQRKIEIALGNDVDADEASWWAAILSSDRGWEFTTEYNQRTYLSPWSVSLSNIIRIGVKTPSSFINIDPPSSNTALEYLARFCSRYRLYGQCSAALSAALYIPYLSGKSASLSLPRPVLQSQSSTFSQPAQSSNLVAEHGKLLTYYMALSCNVWGMRSLLHSTFFNAEIECNLVSAWLNPAFAIIDQLLQEDNQSMLANVLARRQPRLGCLWLGAVLVGIAKSTFRDIRIGLTALELNASAWTGIEQSFITGKPSTSDGLTIRREDECRLLFITHSDGYTRIPLHPWKPFGETRLHNAEIPVQQHAQCKSHFLDYKSWRWSLTNSEILEDLGIATIELIEASPTLHKPEQSPIHCNYNLSSQLASEIATRGIFCWLRSTGYPANEKPIYRHSWIDMESSDEEYDDIDSDNGDGADCLPFIDEWLSRVN